MLVALRRRGFDEPAVRRWSETFPRDYALYITLWDLDEGYTPPKPWQEPLIAGFHRIEGPLMKGFRCDSAPALVLSGRTARSSSNQRVMCRRQL